MTDFERLVKQLGGNPDLKPGEIGISDVQTRNAQTAAAASKPAAVIKPAITPASNVPTIHALGAGDYGASKATRLNSTVNAGIKSTQASFANIRGQLLAPTGELTIGQNAQAAVHGISQQTAEAQKTASQRKYQAKAYALADDLAKQSAEDTAKAKEGLGKVGRTLVDVGVAGTQMLGDLAMNAILPGASLAAMTARSYGQSSQQARQAGANELQQVGYGAAAATVEALTEKLFDGLAGLYGGGVADDVVEKVIGKIAKSGKGMTALRALANFSGEGLEEIVSDAVNPVIRSIYDGKSVGKNYSQEKIADWLHDGLVGGILGLAGAGTQVITGQNAQKNAEAKAANGYASLKPMTAAEQAAHNKVLALNPQKAQTNTNVSDTKAQEATAVIQSLAGTRSKSSQNAVSPQTQNVTPETQNAPTVERGASTEIVQPNAQAKAVSPRAMQTVDYLAAKMDSNPTFADVRAYATQMGEPNIIKEVSDAISIGALKVGRENGEISYNSTYEPPQTSTSSIEAQPSDGLGAADKGFTGEPTPFDVWSDNTPASEMHPVGENPTRAIDLPKVNPQGENTMATARTVMEAEATPNSRIPEIQQYMVDGNLSYVPVENSTLAENASKDIEYSGWGAAHTKWVKAVSSGKTSPELVAMGATLLNNAGNTSTVSAGEYLDLLTDYSELLHRSGQALQAARILKTLSPEGRLYGIQRSVQSMVDKMKDGTEVTIDADLIDEYRKAETDEARDKAISKIQQNVAGQIPSTVLDKFTALRYVNMLGNFKTQARNIAGNTGMMLLTKVKNETAAAFEKFLPADQRTKSFGYSKGLYSAAWKDFLKVQSIAMGEGKFQEGFDGSQFAREVNDKRTIFKNNGEWGTKSDSSGLAKAARKVTDTLWQAPEAYRRATNWAMEQGDVIFNRITYADTLAGYLRAKGYSAEQLTNGQIPDDVLDKARMFAINEAQEATFRDTNALSGWASKVGRRRDTPKAIKVVSEGNVPFRKTPANIAVRAEEYSPLGLVNTVVKGVQAKMNVHEVSGADVVNSLAKTVTGSGLAFIGFELAKAGWLRGKSDDDKQEDFDKLTGQQDYSVQIPGGVSFTLDWLTPGSMPIFMGAQLYNAIAENGFQAGDIEKTLTSIADPMVEMSMLSGVNDALDNIKYAENNLGQFALSSAVNYLTQGLTNTMAGQIERTVEDTRKTTFINREQGFPWLQTALGKASAKTPGVDYNQINYIDAWGRKTDTGSTTSKIANNFFNPAYVSKNNTTALDTELQRLYDAGQTNVLPQRAETSTKVNDKSLTGDEYEKYQTTKGQTSYNILRKAVSTFDYKNMTDEQKAKVVAGAYEYSTYKANRQIAAQRGESSEKSEWDKYADAEKNGVDFWTMWKIKHPEDKNGNGKADEKEQKAVINALAGITSQQKTYLRNSIK